MAFSIIIPTYNSAETLEMALNSISQQTNNNVEVVIMDGGSEDTTLEIAKSYEDKINQLVVHSEKDKGIYDAMNKGLEKATGNWVLFMGSDDTFYDHTVLQDVAKVVEKSSANVIYGNAKIVGDTGWAKDGEVYAGEFDLPKLLNQNICHQAMFYNLDFVKNEIGTFNLRYKKSSDWDFNLRCWSKQPFKFMDRIIANFSAGGFSSNCTDTALIDDYVYNVCKYFKLTPFHPLVNNPNFVFYKQTLKVQQEKYPLRFASRRFKKRFLKKLKHYFGIY